MSEVRRFFLARACTWFWFWVWVSPTRHNSGVGVSVFTCKMTCKLNNKDCILSKMSNNTHFQCYEKELLTCQFGRSTYYYKSRRMPCFVL
jgi:hypothetical protein